MKTSMKRKRPSEAAVWKPVDVSLPEPEAKSRNHYDDDGGGGKRKTSRLVPNDLEGRPGEEMGFFFGLETIPADAYRVETKTDGTKRFQILSKDDKEKNNEEHGGEKAATKANTTSKKKQKSDDDGKVNPSKKVKTKKQKEKAAKQQTTEKSTSKEGKTTSSKKDDDEHSTSVVVSDDQITSLQLAWSSATGGVVLHKHLCACLASQSFFTPTPIQAAALAPAILGRRNIVGSAPTGSGKTLAFLLPICQDLLERRDENDNDNDTFLRSLPLQALILTPTRELALQIHKECHRLLPGSIGTLVGGLAHAKQVRVLQQQRPPILVATPGRLWELMSSREHDHLKDLSQIRHLVIDEADRMVQQGSFPQLTRIFDAIQRANPMDDDDESTGEDDEDADDDQDRMLGLPGIPGEARLTMLNDEILQRLNQQRTEEDEPPQVKEIDDEEFEEQQREIEFGNDLDEDEVSLPVAPPVQRRTYIYSATLTLPASANYKTAKKRLKMNIDVDGAIAEILEKSRAKGVTKVIDLTNGMKKAKQTKSDGDAKIADDKFCLPPGLTLKQIKCTQKHKDSHLYAYLMTSEEAASGPSLVFCNSIAAVRRIGSMLKTLGLDVQMLHAHMQQRQRFQAIESLKQSSTRKVVVSTDVAARGLDIAAVAVVVHYDVARTVDTFVHRSGRTARGMGDGAVGTSLSLVASGEDKNHTRIVDSLNTRFEEFHLDGRLLAASQERVNLAAKVISAEEIHQKAAKNNRWFKEKAAEAGLEVDDDMLDDGICGGDDVAKQHKRNREAKAAKGQLRRLLAEPMQTQRHGKFLSTNSSLMKRARIDPIVQPDASSGRRNKKRRKQR